MQLQNRPFRENYKFDQPQDTQSSVRAVLFHRWWLEESIEENATTALALSEDIAMCCFCAGNGMGGLSANFNLT